ncbi:MAG: serine hydrolase domain-containing protein [Pseudomonadota bacterium]
MAINFIQYSVGRLSIIGVVSLAMLAGAVAKDPQNIFEPILDVHEAQENVGLAAVLRSDGILADSVYVGAAVVEYDIPVTRETRFQVMSVTKAFVGAALVKSVSAGLVDLDVPIQTYLPNYPTPPNGDITLRRLAAHTAGIPHLSHPDRKAVYVEHYADARASLAAFRDLPLVHEPGAAYAYSSAGYTLIAAVLETVHDMSFPNMLREVVLIPLGLNATGSGDVQAPTSNLARSYSYIDLWTYQPVDQLLQVPTWDFSYNLGGGNLITTADDLARFGDAFTKPGFFTKEELDLIGTQIAPEISRWGMGWFVNESDSGEKYLSISGATPGVQAGIVVYPASDTVITALSNAWGKNSAGGDLVVGAPQRVVENWRAKN